MSTSTDLLTLESGRVCEALFIGDAYEATPEKAEAEEVMIVSGTLTVSF